MLELRHVSKSFAGISAVHDVTFSARPGEVTGYLGPNGSGKSTTMKMITGLMEMTSGEILFESRRIQHDLIGYKQRMGYVPEEPHLYAHLSGIEYLVMVGQLRNLPRQPILKRVDGLLQLFGLHGDRHVAISSYSKGMRQKILLSAALLHNPQLLLLDEPFSGLDIGSALVLRSLIQELATRGKVVLFSSHELETVERVCSRVVILHRGKIVADDSIERLRSLMTLPTLKAFFRSWRSSRIRAPFRARSPILSKPETMPTPDLQFRILYREFLFRTVDLELLSPQGDMSRLLGQFAALLVFTGSLLTLSTLGFGPSPVLRTDLLISAWGIEHMLIATTMLVVGLFAVLSWDSTFPDQRDVLVLGPLPVRARTLFLAKVAASGTALSLTVFALNAFTGITLPLALAPASSSLLRLLLSLETYRLLAAYWIAMLAAGAFIFCCVLALQGLTSQLLPRRWFLKLSAFLQMAALCAFVCIYFLQPSWTNPLALAAPENQPLLAWLPSYWFLGLWQELNGSMHPAMIPLARRAWIGLGAAVTITALAYVLSYFRTLRRIVEEPDILPSSVGLRWSPPFGDSLSTAIVQFSVRTLLRSRQHRVMLAFYLAMASALIILLMRAGLARSQAFSRQAETPLLFSSLSLTLFCIVGTRVVFSMPLALRANWVFRVTEVRRVTDYLAAIRRPLFLIALVPVWTAATILFLSIWPWEPAARHSVVLALWGMIIVYLCLQGFQKIPFTCSYLPGKSYFHMAFLGAITLLTVIVRGAEFEQRALVHPDLYFKMLAFLSVAAALARWRMLALAKSDEAIVQFEEQPAPPILSLGLSRDGVPLR